MAHPTYKTESGTTYSITDKDLMIRDGMPWYDNPFRYSGVISHEDEQKIRTELGEDFKEGAKVFGNVAENKSRLQANQKFDTLDTLLDAGQEFHLAFGNPQKKEMIITSKIVKKVT